jgi:hypothetical protein
MIFLLIIYLLFICFLFIFYFNKFTIGLRNYFIYGDIDCYFIIEGKFNKQQFIETLKSYNFDVKIDKNTYIAKYKNNKIIQFSITTYKTEYKIDIIFDHKYFIMNTIHVIINNYLKNDTNKKILKEHKDFYYNDINIINILYTSIINQNKNYQYKKIIINKNYIEKIQSKSSEYISKIDILISIITNLYFKVYNKHTCNISLVKCDKINNDYYLGNPVTMHLIKINDKSNIATQVRRYHKNEKIPSLFENIDIYITSWLPIENHDNKIKEIDFNNKIILNKNLILGNFYILLCMKNNDYIINLYYL